MSLNVPLLRSSFDLVIERQPQLTKRFYEIFFARYPQVKPMFGGSSSPNQQLMLQGALAAVIEHLEDGAWLTETLRAMGRKHVDYGVRDEMYAWVGASLLATLSEVAGSDWTPELEVAWTEAYSAIAGLMQSGAREVSVA